MPGFDPAVGDVEMSKKKKNGRNKNGNGNGHEKETEPAPASPATPPIRPAAAITSALAGTLATRRAATPKNNFARDFSQVVAVLMRAPNYKNLRISDLEWLVIPPLLAGQCRTALSRFSKDGPFVPVAAALWARVSPSVDKRLSEELDKPPLLRASEWTSGDIIWLITLAGEPKALAEFLPQLQKADFNGRPVKMRVQMADGKTVVQTLTGPVAAKV